MTSSEDQIIYPYQYPFPVPSSLKTENWGTGTSPVLRTSQNRPELVGKTELKEAN